MKQIIIVLLVITIIWFISIIKQESYKEGFQEDLITRTPLDDYSEQTIATALQTLTGFEDELVVHHLVPLLVPGRAAGTLPPGVPSISFDYGTLSDNKLLTKAFKEVGGINFVDNVELVPYILKMVIRLQKQINQQNEIIQALAINGP
jgi:hypothetical protein